MKKISKLSKECISHNGLCCENRVNAILTKEEEKNLFSNNPEARVSKCEFFKKPYCSIYSKRPVDCKTYPVNIDLRSKKVIFVIDLKCPAVKKGIIDKKFISYATKEWKSHWPNKEWIIKNSEDNKNKKMYHWITLPEYLKYREKLNS